ncbi:sensor histidine kinase [Actinacidiphila acidipaludis]|uniref:histidine kinase n=1 Tax=Actinacidiphila acidipaludis TaxID=2873382 RepID=A0ABS7Q6W2_9ACTN|nr:sensor histidine kinase [Streptomyces acidipaludis]
MRGPRTPSRPRSLAGQLFAMQVVIVAVVVAGGAVLAYVNARDRAEAAARNRVVSTAGAIADSPAVVRAAVSTDPTAALQPYAQRVVGDAGVDFVTIMDPHGIRWTHVDPSLIGKPFLGHIAPALEGRTFTETYTGTLGPSVRVVTPIRDGTRIVGLVSVGIEVDRISRQVRGQLSVLLAVASAALALGGLGTYVVNRRLRRHTHGMTAAGLSGMYDYHQATLHALREGLVLLDSARRVVLCNDAARELLGLRGEVVGRSCAELGLPPSLTGALLSAEPRVDEVHLTAERVVVVNTSPVRGAEHRGTVVTLRDHTDLQALTGELDSVRGFAEALRSQAHEASNRLHTVVSLIELGRTEEAVDFATSELRLAQALTDRVVTAVGEPVLAALLLGKAAEAHERGVELTVTEDSRIDDGVLPPELAARDLVTVLGNLLDNAVDAAIEGAGPGGARPAVTVTARALDGELLLRVTDSGPGVDPATISEVFRRGWTTKSQGRGLGLALVEQAARRGGGTVGLRRADGGGAEFTVRLPLRPAGQEAHA